MIESAETDDPSDETPQALIHACGEVTSVDGHNEDSCVTDTAVATLVESGSDEAAQQAALREVIAGKRQTTAEVLITMCQRAHQEGDRATLNLAFEALSKIAAPLLLSQAWSLSAEDRRDQVQHILMEVFAAIQAGKGGFAQRHFAAFAKRRSISLYRKRRSQFEGVNKRIEPSENDDPIDGLPARLPSAEVRALLAIAIDKLPPKHRAAFIQYHRFEMTHEEIAAHHGVDESTVRYWLKKAAVATGLTGDEK